MSIGSKIGRIEELRALISRRASGRPAAEICPLGLSAVDAILGGGLPTGCLQEVIPADRGAAAAGFAAFLLGRLATDNRVVLWASLGEGDLYPPGLAAFGLLPARVIQLSAPSPAELLWAMEEALRSPALAGVLGEVDRVDQTASRRLQLAASVGGTVGFLLLRFDRPAVSVSSAALRWRVGALPGDAWKVELLRQRAGRPCAWVLEKEDATDRFTVAAELGDGPAAPAARLSC